MKSEIKQEGMCGRKVDTAAGIQRQLFNRQSQRGDQLGKYFSALKT